MLCIPRTISEKIRGAIRSGDLPLEKLADMTSGERRAAFSEFVGKESSELLNAEFEKSALAAQKKALADYVSASDKEEFAKKATAGEFAKKLLSDQQKARLAIDANEAKASALRERYLDMEQKAKDMEGEQKLNAEAKIAKLKDQEARLNAKTEDLKNPLNDRLLKKIDSIKTLLSPAEEKAFLEDAVKSKMGQDVTPAQGKYIVDKASELKELRDKPTDALSGVSAEYDNARQELNNYIESLKPDQSSALKNLIEISRNNLITNISTPLKTFISGTTNDLAGRLTRRIASGTLSGADGELADLIAKENFEKFSKTGLNDAARSTIDDTGAPLDSKGKGKTVRSFTENEDFGTKAKATGEGIIQKARDLSHKIAITFEHNIPFTHIYGRAFADIVNVKALDFAKLEGLSGDEAKARGSELMRDAARIEPKTPEGRILRQAGQEGAARVLNANNTWASRFSVGMKNAMNSIVKDAPIGDLIEPIAKIPANIIANGIDNTPIAIARELPQVWDAIKGNHDLQSDDLQTRYKGLVEYRNGIEHLVRIVGSVGAAALLASNLKPKDFRSDKYGNHFVRIGDTWVNTEYFASISPNISAFMAMRMNPKENPIQAAAIGGKAGEGALGSLIHLPGVNEAYQTASSVLSGKAPADLAAQAESRALPVAVQDMFKDRPVERIFFGAEGVESQKEYAKDQAASKAKAAKTRADNRAKASKR